MLFLGVPVSESLKWGTLQSELLRPEYGMLRRYSFAAVQWWRSFREWKHYDPAYPVWNVGE